MIAARILRNDPTSENDAITLITELSYLEDYVENFYFELVPDLKLCKDLSLIYNEIAGFNYIGILPPGEVEFDMIGRIEKIVKIRTALKKLLWYDELEDDVKQSITTGVALLKRMINRKEHVGVGLIVS